MTRSAVDVVILTWNDGELLQRAVNSANADRDGPTRVFVIDNASDAPPQLMPEPDLTQVRNPSNRGVAAARNQGAALGTSPFILLLDSDAELEPGCLSALVAVLDADPTIALAAPVFTDQAPEASGGRAPGLARKLARGLGLTARYRGVARPTDAPFWDVDFAIGACQLVRRAAWDAVGGLDESYFYGPEDLDFCLRLTAQGGRVVQVGGAHCHHPPRRRNRSLFRPGGVRHARALLRHYARGTGSAR
jgi:N-acetylglucosaminyl-diphospho-decaprenol L-rhamnosyltransferase